jgi:hypothetical protein
MAPKFPIETKNIIMDRKLIQQYGTEILSYRLRTVRQKKRMQYEDFDKQLIQLYKEDKALGIKAKNLGWESLTPPVQKGWKRFFVLRDDVARSKHAGFFEKILKKINTYDWSYRKDFKIRKRKFGRKQYVVKPQNLLQPNPYRFAKLGFSDEEKQFFHEEWSYNRSGELVKHYVFIEPWRFVLRVRPNMIDKIKRIDGEIESRSKEIDNYLDTNHYRKRLSRILDGACYKYWKRYDAKDARNKSPFRNKSFQQILNDVEAGLL